MLGALNKNIYRSNSLPAFSCSRIDPFEVRICHPPRENRLEYENKICKRKCWNHWWTKFEAYFHILIPGGWQIHTSNGLILEQENACRELFLYIFSLMVPNFLNS